MALQSRQQHSRQRRRSILVSLPAAHHHFSRLEVEILHSHTQSLQQPHTRSVQQPRHKLRRTAHRPEQPTDLFAREHHRRALPSRSTHKLRQPRNFLTEHIAIEKKNCRQRLALRRRRYMPLHSQMRQVFVDLVRSHRARMSLSMKENETPRPLNIGILSADAVVARPEHSAHAIEKSWPFHRRRGSLGVGALSKVLHGVEWRVALSSTIYNVSVDLSDVDRGVYQSLALRMAMHPSESMEYMATRLMAYCLEYTDGIEMTEGLSDGNEPAIMVRDLTGRITAW